MQSKSEGTSRIIANPYNISSSVACAEPWWRSMNCNSISPSVMGGNTSNSSSMEQSKDGQSQSDGGLDEEDDDAVREPQITASPCSDGNYGQAHQNFDYQSFTLPLRSNEGLTQPPQLELVGHSIACASNPYLDPYYGGMMAPYGPQPLVPHLLDMNHARMPLPLEVTQQPVYVNAKQYNGILRRRQLRAKAEVEKKLIKVRKPYLHESRHQHAMRRVRGSGGRFAKKTDTTEETVKALDSAGSLASETLHGFESAVTQNGHQGANQTAG